MYMPLQLTSDTDTLVRVAVPQCHTDDQTTFPPVGRTIHGKKLFAETEAMSR